MRVKTPKSPKDVALEWFKNHPEYSVRIDNPKSEFAVMIGLYFGRPITSSTRNFVSVYGERAIIKIYDECLKHYEALKVAELSLMPERERAAIMLASACTTRAWTNLSPSQRDKYRLAINLAMTAIVDSER